MCVEGGGGAGELGMCACVRVCMCLHMCVSVCLCWCVREWRVLFPTCLLCLVLFGLLFASVLLLFVC